MHASVPSLSRRSFIRGASVSLALPFLDAMVPAFASAPKKTPVRMAFLYVPNGIMMDGWNPDQEGKLDKLPRILKPLDSLKEDILHIGNLTHNTGRALLDGAGDHGRCSASYLTGAFVKKTMVDIQAGVSCDQIVANQIERRHWQQQRSENGALSAAQFEHARRAAAIDRLQHCRHSQPFNWE